MHVPEKWQMGAIDKIHDFINQYGFATIVSKELEASHLPLLIAKNKGDNGVLSGHFARSNPHWKKLDGSEVLIIFSGPHSYISPTWYAQQPSVPKWNYNAVHVTGTLKLTDDGKTLEILQNLIEKYEPSLLHNGGFIPDEYKTKLAKAVVGFEINIVKLQGKEKLGQHRNIEDQISVLKALKESTDDNAISLYKYMKKHNITDDS